MSSEVIVILVLVALAIGFLVWLEIHSRRNQAQMENEEHPSKAGEGVTQKTVTTERR